MQPEVQGALQVLVWRSTTSDLCELLACRILTPCMEGGRHCAELQCSVASHVDLPPQHWESGFCLLRDLLSLAGSLEARLPQVELAPLSEEGCLQTARPSLVADCVQPVQIWMPAVWQVLDG